MQGITLEVITKAEADALIAEDKVITANIVWRSWHRGQKMEPVLVLGTVSGAVLRLLGWIGPRNRSFVLLYNNCPIRKWTVHARTKAPDGTRIDGPHKHTWDDILGDEYAYVPDDIRIGNPWEELEDFLRECNVTLLGSFGIQSSQM